jgi:hypothetical protein
MLRAGQAIFLHFPSGPGERILQPAMVRESSGGSFVAEFLEGECAPPDAAAGKEIVIYYSRERGFFRQSVRIVEILSNAEREALSLSPIREPEATESREAFRVSTSFAEVAAVLGDDRDCQVRDVSATGLAVISSSRYLPGDLVPMTLEHDGEKYLGAVEVRNVRPWRFGGFRYGLECVDDRDTGGNLSRGLSRVTLDVQRRQLSRRATRVF